MEVILSGIGTAHDALAAAALRACGYDARTVPAPTREDLALGRRWMSPGHPSTVHALVGALIRDLSGRPAKRRTFVTLDGWCSHYGSDYRRALSAAGVRNVAVHTVDPSGRRRSHPGLTDHGAGRALLRAAVLGDVVERLAAERRSTARDPLSVDLAVHEALGRLWGEGHDPERVEAELTALRSRLDALPRRYDTPSASVWLVGEFFPSVTGGGLFPVGRWLERRGARVRATAVTEWLLYALWGLGEVPGSRHRRLRDELAALFARYASAAGLADPSLLDPDALSGLPGDLASAEWRGRSAHLEVAAWLAAERSGAVDLVVSLKPFASVPSSAVSDALLRALSRGARTAFASLELHGDAEAQLESRLELELALARARRRDP